MRIKQCFPQTSFIYCPSLVFLLQMVKKNQNYEQSHEPRNSNDIYLKADGSIPVHVKGIEQEMSIHGSIWKGNDRSRCK